MAELEEAYAGSDTLDKQPLGKADGRLLPKERVAAVGDPDARAQDVMEPGPSTTRPDTPPDRLHAKLQRAELTTAVLTDPEGRLLGLVRRTDLRPAHADG